MRNENEKEIIPKIEQIEISKLTLLENNPRKISKDQFKKLVDSLKLDSGFFWNRPCLVNQDDSGTLTVYAGNQRVQAAKKLKWKRVPCIIEKNLSPELVKERIVKDNKHYGQFDIDMLANEWELESLVAAGFSIDELGLGDTEEMETLEKKKKKEKRCPHCNEIL